MEEYPNSTASLEISDRVPQRWNWKDILLISAFAAVIILAGFGLLRILAQRSIISLEDTNTQIFLSLGSLILETVALILPIYLLGIRRKKISWSELGIRSCRLEWVLLAGLLGFIAIPLSGLVALIIQLLLGKPLENPQLPFLAPAGLSVFGGIAMFILGGFLAPFAEELFFRGILYRWLRQRWGVAPGILISGLIFGILHGDWAVGGAAFVLGIILAWSFEKSNSLWAAFIIHAINNSVKIALLYLLLASGLLSGLT
jgi:membrane protease YdiL (CAAX protease family)